MEYRQRENKDRIRSTSNPRKEVFLFYKIESPLSNFYAARFEVSGKWYTIVQSNSTYTKKPHDLNKIVTDPPKIKHLNGSAFPMTLCREAFWESSAVTKPLKGI
ncbi:uncharacterized protein LOC143044838 [Mytilus galloprovincialis]|uniref:Uncharacterized protein n=1 Tax=Mytilus galloprovincialis TaxID=29158 RepID=A0A8B6DU20_MYTGA|nr:Hypothetical predicted protein [Mytilus galloprovincialis]